MREVKDMNNQKLPDFETLEQFAEFVEIHNMTDYLDDFERVSVNRPQKERIGLGLPSEVLKEIKGLANQRGKPYQTLIREWIYERLAQEHNC
jgi:predicted DNA binding CopG/RHH family protein